MLVVLLLVSGVACDKPPLSGTALIEGTLKCRQLYAEKKEGFWGSEVGNNKSRLDPSTQRCLAMNIVNRKDKDGNDYSIMVIDVVTDETVLYFTLKKGDAAIGYASGDSFVKCKQSSGSYDFRREDGSANKENWCDDINKDLASQTDALKQVAVLGFKP